MPHIYFKSLMALHLLPDILLLKKKTKNFILMPCYILVPHGGASKCTSLWSIRGRADVPLDRVQFLAFVSWTDYIILRDSVLNRVLSWTGSQNGGCCPAQGGCFPFFCPKQGQGVRFSVAHPSVGQVTRSPPPGTCTQCTLFIMIFQTSCN